MPAIAGATFGAIAVTSTATSNSDTTNITASADGSPNLANTAVGDTYPMSIQIFDSLGVPYNLDLRFVKTGITTGTDRKSTRLTPVTNAHLVCRLLLEKKNKQHIQH